MSKDHDNDDMPEEGEPEDESLEIAKRLPPDLRKLAGEMSLADVRGTVDIFYTQQRFRINAEGKTRAALQHFDEVLTVQPWFTSQLGTLETMAKASLAAWVIAESRRRPQGGTAYAIEQKGIGPVLAAGLAADIDIDKAPTAGAIWRFAGLDPTTRWDKGEKRPWNGRLKVACWKIGDSFVKQSSREGAPYARVYLHRKEEEVRRNLGGERAEQASATLVERSFAPSPTRNCYAGVFPCAHLVRGSTKCDPAYEDVGPHLPPGRIELRARRIAVKLFLSHWQGVQWRDVKGTEPPAPYAFSHLGHGHFIPPFWGGDAALPWE